MQNFSKNIDIWLLLWNLNIWPHLRGRGEGGGGGKILITVMLIYKHWVIMTYSEKLSDIKALGKWEVYHTKKPI